MIRLFISYCHSDEETKNRLEKFLINFKREKLITTWSDTEMVVGSHLDSDISEAQQKAELFLAIVSQDYIASQYCYEIELAKALEMRKDGKTHILPIIAEHSTWKETPLGQLKAAPKDGNPISEWTNKDVAFLDIEQEIRKVINAINQVQNQSIDVPDVKEFKRQLSIKQARDFTSIDKMDYQDEAYRTITNYFASSVAELQSIESLQARFEKMETHAFSAKLINKMKKNCEASITVRNSRGSGGFLHTPAILISHSFLDQGSTFNNVITVGNDEYSQFLVFELDLENSNATHSPQEAASRLWVNFMKNAEIEYA